MAAMTVGVTKSRLLAYVRNATLVARRTADEVVAADQLAVAATFVDAARRAGTEVVAGAQRIDVLVTIFGAGGEGRAAEVDARVDDADHHTFATERRRCAVPQRRCADQPRSDVGVLLILPVLFNQLHIGKCAHALRFLRIHLQHRCVDRMLHAPFDLYAATQFCIDAGLVLYLAVSEEAHIVLRACPLYSDARCRRIAGGCRCTRGAGGWAHAFRCREALDVALVGGQRLLAVDHDIAVGELGEAATRTACRRSGRIAGARVHRGIAGL